MKSTLTQHIKIIFDVITVSVVVYEMIAIAIFNFFLERRLANILYQHLFIWWAIYPLFLGILFIFIRFIFIETHRKMDA